MTDQGDGPLDARVIECAVAGGYGGDPAAADAVTAWIAETIRRGVPKGSRPRPSEPHAERRLVCRWLDQGDPRGRSPAAATRGSGSPSRATRPTAGCRECSPIAGETLGEQWAEAHENDRKETLAMPWPRPSQRTRRRRRSSSPTTPASGRSAGRRPASSPPAPPPSRATPTSPPPPSSPPA